jgi:hypothetical protein
MLHSAIHAVEWRIRLSGEVARDRLLLNWCLPRMNKISQFRRSPKLQNSGFRHRPNFGLPKVSAVNVHALPFRSPWSFTLTLGNGTSIDRCPCHASKLIGGLASVISGDRRQNRSTTVFSAGYDFEPKPHKPCTVALERYTSNCPVRRLASRANSAVLFA